MLEKNHKKPDVKKIIADGRDLAVGGAAKAIEGVGAAKKGVAKGAGIALGGLSKGAAATKDGIAKGAGVVRNKSKEAQMAVLTHIAKKKNARFFEAKMQSFEDGLKKGKVEAIDYIKKYTNYCLAITALSYYFAGCDGEIAEEERLEIQYDLDAILKNKDMPEAVRNQMAKIASQKKMSFDELKNYLDDVGIETLQEFQKDVDEIIFADEIITPEEERAKERFDEYVAYRVEIVVNE